MAIYRFYLGILHLGGESDGSKISKSDAGSTVAKVKVSWLRLKFVVV